MNEFIDFSIQDEYDAFMDVDYNNELEMKPQLANQATLNPVKNEPSGSIFNMEEEFCKSIPSLSPNISPLRKTFEFPCSSSKLGGQIFRKVLNSKYLYPSQDNFKSFNFNIFGRAEHPVEDNEKYLHSPMRSQMDMRYGMAPLENYNRPANSERSCLSNHGDSRQNSGIRIPPRDIRENTNDVENSSEFPSTYRRLKIPRLSNFQFYPRIADQVSESTGHFMKEHRDIESSQVDDSCSNTHTFGQHETMSQGDKDSDMVGPLTKKQREAKVKKFLEKRKRRQFNKKVCYESRKKVADTRPRYKGRFVSFEQAGELADDLKKEMEKKLAKSRVFVTEIFDKKTKEIRKVIFPNKESMQRYTASKVV